MTHPCSRAVPQPQPHHSSTTASASRLCRYRLAPLHHAKTLTGSPRPSNTAFAYHTTGSSRYLQQPVPAAAGETRPGLLSKRLATSLGSSRSSKDATVPILQRQLRCLAFNGSIKLRQLRKALWLPLFGLYLYFLCATVSLCLVNHWLVP